MGTQDFELIPNYCEPPKMLSSPGWFGEQGSSGKGREGPVALSYNAGRISTETGARVLDQIPTSKSSTHAVLNAAASKEWGALVLGFQSSVASSCVDIPIGQLWCHRLLAIARCKLWWMTPAWGFKGKDVPPETQMLLLEAEINGPYVIMLPLIDGQTFRATLRPGRSKLAYNYENSYDVSHENCVTLRIESGEKNMKANSWDASLLVAASWDPFALVDSAVAAAAALSGGGRPLSAKTLPPSLDVFGWCTWDAFYTKISARDLSVGVKSLSDGGTPPRLVILDDGWQTTELDEKHQVHDTAVLDEARVLQTQHSFLHHEAEELAAHAGGSAASIATMPLLQLDEDSRSQPQGNLCSMGTLMQLLRSIVSPIWGWIMGLSEWLFIKFYKNVIEPADWNSRTVRCFAWCATRGPLKPPLLQFFATSGTFLRRLTTVKANHKFASPESGPHAPRNVESDLKSVVSFLRERFGVDYFYCWHGLSGYWGGVSLEAAGVANLPVDIVFANPTPGVMEVEPAMNWGPASLAGVGIVRDPVQLYQDMHSYLSECGVTGVKVDCQAGVGLVPGPGGGPISAHRCHQALEASVAEHFPGNHLINCMGHSTENFYRYTKSAIARACDDFYPADPASHTAHIGNAAYNALFLGALVQPDWDMFQSKHPAAELHGVARAVCGGAVYVSDKPGEHDFSLLQRLVLPDGAVLRARLPGRPTRDSLFKDPMRDGHSLLKVWNRNAFGGVVGVFNIQGASWDRSRRRFHVHDSTSPWLSTGVSPNDVWDLRTADSCKEFLMWYSIAQKFQLVAGEGGHVMVKLGPACSEVITVVPVLQEGSLKFAPLGLTMMFNPGGAVESCSILPPNNSLHVQLRVRGSGVFCCFSTLAPTSCRLDGQAIPFTYTSNTQLLELELPVAAEGGTRLSNKQLDVLY